MQVHLVALVLSRVERPVDFDAVDRDQRAVDDHVGRSLPLPPCAVRPAVRRGPSITSTRPLEHRRHTALGFPCPVPTESGDVPPVHYETAVSFSEFWLRARMMELRTSIEVARADGIAEKASPLFTWFIKSVA
jgi:hypothetical protein